MVSFPTSYNGGPSFRASESGRPQARTRLLVLVLLCLTGCAGTAPSRSLDAFVLANGLPDRPPVVLVDLDDTIYDKSSGAPMPGAQQALRDLARDHLIVYLTARATYAKLPGLTHNRSDSKEFLEAYGFPDGALFTSSFWNWMVHGQGGGKVESFRQIRAFGIGRIALAVGDRPHDLEAYLENGLVAVEKVVIILGEDAGRWDPDRDGLPEETLSRSIPGQGPAWPRIVAAYRLGELNGSRTWIVSQPDDGDSSDGE